MSKAVFEKLQYAHQTGHKLFALLIDPDQLSMQSLDRTIVLLHQHPADIIMVGGSLLLDEQLERCLDHLRKSLPQPLLLFPGSLMQISSKADALLLLSLISGRNPELLIGQHVTAAPYLRASGLEIIPTGYMLVDGGKPTTASYISHTQPMPADKPEVAVCTAMAGEMLGLHCLYLDAGSGAQEAVSPKIIQAVRQSTNLPIITGGGIRTPEQVTDRLAAGADMLVVGNAIEKNPTLLAELRLAFHVYNERAAPK